MEDLYNLIIWNCCCDGWSRKLKNIDVLCIFHIESTTPEMTKIQKTENKGNGGCSTEWYNIWDNRSPEAKPFASLSFNAKRNKNPHSPGAQQQLKWWQCWQILESDSHKQPSNELPDILEWNPEDDKDDLGGTDEDLVIVMTRNSNNNEDVTQVMWLDGQNF